MYGGQAEEWHDYNGHSVSENTKSVYNGKVQCHLNVKEFYSNFGDESLLSEWKWIKVKDKLQ